MSPCLQSWRHFSSNARFYLLSNQRLCISLLYLWVEQHFNHGRKLVSLKEMIGMFKDTHRKNAPSNKTPVLTKIMKMDNWVVGTSNQLFSKRFLNWNKIFKKIKQFQNSFLLVHLVLFILFVFTLDFDMAVLYGNDAFSILVLWTKKRYSIFLKKVFVFQRNCFKVKVLKTFKISTDFYIKTYQSLKRRAVLKVPRAIFQKNLCSFCWI